MCLKTQRLVRRSFSFTLTLLAATLLLAADPAAAQRIRFPHPSKAPLTGPNLAVAGGEWDFFVAGDHLNFRAGSAKMTEPFHSMTLPSAGMKLAADRQNVYVWLDDRHIMAYALGDQGPTGPGVPRAGDDPSAAEAFQHPYIAASRMHVQAVTPSQIQAISPQRLYVANSGSDNVTAINTSTNQVLGTIALVTGANPVDLQVSPNNFAAYTANEGSGTTCSTCTNLGAQSFDPLALTSAGNTLPATAPIALAFTPDATQVFVGDDINVNAFNTSTGASTGTVQAVATVEAMTVTPDGKTLYSLDDDDAYYYYVNNMAEPVNAVSVITVAGLGSPTHYQIPVNTGSGNPGDGIGCYGLALSPANGNLYVACNWELYGSSATPAVYELSISGGNLTIVNTFNTPGGSIALAFSPDGSKLYVALYSANSVIVMDPNAGTQLATIPVGSTPYGIVVNSSGTRAYTANNGGNSVSVLDLSANSVVTTVAVGTAPFAVALSYAPPGSSIGNVAATVNGASFAPTAPVAVGSLVSLFGTSIGPSTSATATSIPLPTTLSTYQVKIGGIFAPLLYVSSGQINCQIPFELAGQTSAQVIVSNSTVSSSPGTVNLATSAPGIFVGSGTQGAVLNADNSPNSATNPAARGSVVQIFATGQGVVSNQPADGKAAPSSPPAITAITPVVAIGGLPATVQFSGLAPGFVGLWQVNAVVPAGVTPGGAVSLTIALNNLSNAVTVGVK